MAGYVGNVPVPQSVREDQSFTATAGQTTFNTLGYTDGNRIKVTLNGVLLEGGGVDYTATNGSDVVLTVAAVVDDIVRFETFNEVQLVSNTSTTPIIKTNLTLKNDTHEDTDGGRESTVIFSGEQSGGEITTLAEIEASHDGTADDQKGDLIFRTNDGNDGTSPTERLRINSGGDMLFSSDDPSLTLANTTHEDSDGGRESTIAFQGEQSGGEVSLLAQIEAAHDGTADDQKGDLIFRTNDGSDGTSPTTAMIIDSAQNVGINATPKATHADADVVRLGGTGYLANWEDAEVYLSENMYQDTSGAYKYLTASHASLYSQTAGKHQFRVAGSGSADGAITFNTALEIDNDGIVTKPLQPAFSAKPTSNQNDIPNLSATTIAFGTEIFDKNADFNTSTSTFTAPVTGLYLLSISVRTQQMHDTSDYYNFEIVTSNRNYQHILAPTVFDSDATYWTIVLTALADMDANDTAHVTVFQAFQSAQLDIHNDSHFSGHLVA